MTWMWTFQFSLAPNVHDRDETGPIAPLVSILEEGALDGPAENVQSGFAVETKPVAKLCRDGEDQVLVRHVESPRLPCLSEGLTLTAYHLLSPSRHSQIVHAKFGFYIHHTTREKTMDSMRNGRQDSLRLNCRRILLALLFVLCGSAHLMAQTVFLEAVSFLPMGSNQPITLWDLRKDVMEPVPIELPHWVAGGGKSEPVVFCRGSQIRVKATLKASGPNIGSWVVSGSSPGFRLPEQNVEFGESLTTDVVFQASAPLPDKVAENVLNIQWFARPIQPPARSVARFANTTHPVLTTFREPIVHEQLFKPLAVWSTRFAEGLSDEKEICDALIRNLHKTGLHYGRQAWSTFAILQKGGGMCGGWSRFFQDLCGVQGVDAPAHIFTVTLDDAASKEYKWTDINILAPGLNNEQPTVVGPLSAVDRVYPRPRFFGDNSPDDDVDYQSNKPIYNFCCADEDGHCVNLLKYKGQHHLYDPSFGSGPFSGFFGENVPNNPLTGDTLSTFRKVYFDRTIDYLGGEIYCKKNKEDLVGIEHLCVRTTLVPDKEVSVVWKRGSMGSISSASATLSRQSRFDALHRTGEHASLASRDQPIDWVSIYRGLGQAALKKGPLDAETLRQSRDFLSRRQPLQIKKGVALPGRFPPLEMLQLKIVRLCKKRTIPELNRDIETLIQETPPGEFRQLLERD